MILNAVICVWNEEDIIESTVKHIFAQGCSNVFIVDNGSTDNTVKNAINAGAKLAAKFKTKDFDEDQKVAHLNATVKYINEKTQEDKIWWLYIDADEFPNFDCEFTILDILKQFDSSIRAVHGYLFDHIPTHPPYHVNGYHPIDFQPLCKKISTSKIPLLRYDKGEKHLFSIGGAHEFITHNNVVPMVRDLLQIHHFPYRNPEYTVKRSKILAETRNNWYKKFLKKIYDSDVQAYEARYKHSHIIYNENKHIILKTKALLYNFNNIVRWYDINVEKKYNSLQYDKSICNAIFNFFMREYDIALCRFKDAFDVCENNEIKLWLLIKIAECFSYSDIDTAHNIISDLEKVNNIEISSYIDKNFNYIRNTNNKNNIRELIGKIEFYQSVFPDGIEERQNELITKIEKTLFKF
jgi:glycosyltransferase involved in cell wall biosynthesis